MNIGEIRIGIDWGYDPKKSDSQEDKKTCPVPKCKNTLKSKGITQTGNKKYRTLCQKHKKMRRLLNTVTQKPEFVEEKRFEQCPYKWHIYGCICHKSEVSQAKVDFKRFAQLKITTDSVGTGFMQMPEDMTSEPSFIDRKIEEFGNQFGFEIRRLHFLRTALEEQEEAFSHDASMSDIIFAFEGGEKSGRLAERKEIEEMIEASLQEVELMDSEAFGWTLVNEGCCPGDDAAGGYTEALKRLCAAIRERK